MRNHDASDVARTGAVECPDCGSVNVETRRLKDRFQYGSGSKAVELEAVVPFHKCANCRFEFTGAAAEDARHEAICHHLGIMTPIEVVGVRQRYDMTRAAFAEKTRIGEASLARWETGQIIQNAANDNYLYLLCFADNMDRLTARYSFAAFPGERRAAVAHSRPRFRNINSDEIAARRLQAHDFLHSRRRTAGQQCI